MSYEKLGFTSGQTLKAEHLNHMEDGIANAGGGSWNDLADKPFGETTPKFDIKWDGNATEKEMIDLSIVGASNMYLVKVNDDVYLADDLIGATVTGYDISTGESYDKIVESDSINSDGFPGSLVLCGDIVVVVYSADTLCEAVGAPVGTYTNGIYFMLEDGAFYASRLVAPTEIKKLDSKYVDIDLDEYVKNTDLGGYVKSTDLAPVATTGSWNDLEDKPFGDVIYDWKQISTGACYTNPSMNNSKVTFNVDMSLSLVDGKAYKIVVEQPINNKSVESITVASVKEVMAGYFDIKLGNPDEIYITTSSTSSSCLVTCSLPDNKVPINVTIYEQTEIVSALDEKYLPPLISPNGKKFKLTVDDNGTITATEITA